MKKLFRSLIYLLAFLVVAVIGVITYLTFASPNVDPAPDIKVELTPERIARGAYLANHVAVCVDCHSTRDFSYYSGPIVAGTEGGGGAIFDESLGFPGRFLAKNITPFNLKHWTDGEIYRAITTGVTKDDGVIFPVMPYKHYAFMHPEDVKDIIAYLRSLPEIENEVEASAPSFPFNLIMKTIPSPATPTLQLDTLDLVPYGRYLTQIAGCMECHTPSDDKGNKIEGMELAGGWKMAVGGGKFVTTANITPHPENGIGNWSEEVFVNRFKAYADSSIIETRLTDGAPQTHMPWVMYSQMKEHDLKAIYSYLMSVPANNNKVTVFE